MIPTATSATTTAATAAIRPITVEFRTAATYPIPLSGDGSWTARRNTPEFEPSKRSI
jgi:hypothetical protein